MVFATVSKSISATTDVICFAFGNGGLAPLHFSHAYSCDFIRRRNELRTYTKLSSHLPQQKGVEIGIIFRKALLCDVEDECGGRYFIKYRKWVLICVTNGRGFYNICLGSNMMGAIRFLERIIS